MLYIDSNVFLYATLSRERVGVRARTLLGEVQKRREDACSSTLTFDEIVWSVKRYRGRKDAIAAGEAFLGFTNLRLIPVDRELLAQALEIIKRYQLDPRDSIHAASAISANVDAIVSTDEHFDRIAGLRRKGI